MRTHHWRVGAVLAALSLVAGACTSDGDAQADDGIQPIESDDTEAADEPEPEPDPEPDPEPEPEPEPDPEPEPEIDIESVPDEITDAYAAAVLEELERLFFEAYVSAMEAGELTLEASDLLDAAFTEESAEIYLLELQEYAASGFGGLRPLNEIRPRRAFDVEVLATSSDCVWLLASHSTDEFAIDGVVDEPAFYELKKRTTPQTVELNRTQWVIDFYGFGDVDEARSFDPCA